ncbi:MAG: flippase-like domain-containing protein [Gemmatimonadaceae bacterium]|nr:flippase-like domain-containing protein [Gemmatimonadaceae bacterium]
MTKRRWQALLGAALTIALLGWTLRDVQPAELLAQLRAADPLLLLLGTVVCFGIFPLRAIRWQVLLEPIAPGLPFMTAFRATNIGMMTNNVLPARAGEFARAFALARTEPRVSFASAFASIALDRVFDALVVFGLMSWAMLDPAFPRGAQVAGRDVSSLLGSVGLLVIAVAFVVALLLALRPAVFEAIATRVVGTVAPSLAARVGALVHHAADGFAALRSPWRFVRVLFWTVAHWLVNATSYYLIFRAVGMTVPFSAALFLQGLVSIGVAIPSSPGFFGPFEAFAKEGLRLYAVATPVAVTWAVAYHLLNFLPITIVGAVQFARLGLSLRDVRGTEPSAREAAAGAS